MIKLSKAGGEVIDETGCMLSLTMPIVTSTQQIIKNTMAAKLFRAVILGPPGSGKGTIAQRIAHSFGLQHLSSGDCLREDIAARTDAGILAKKFIEQGLLVPDHVVTRLMLNRLEKMTNRNWLLDGFPRTLQQAEVLNNSCDLDMVIMLNIPFETLKERLSARWIHPSSGRVYNMEFNPPHIEGIDDISGEPLVRHEDDKPEAVLARLRQYKDVAKPVINFYHHPRHTTKLPPPPRTPSMASVQPRQGHRLQHYQPPTENERGSHVWWAGSETAFHWESPERHYTVRAAKSPPSSLRPATACSVPRPQMTEQQLLRRMCCSCGPVRKS
ncbi:KAD4 kinase, partial [Polypterus senegalus]